MRRAAAGFLALLMSGALAAGAPAARAAGEISVRIAAIGDTVVAHQTAWITVRILNGTDAPVRVPFRSGKIVAEWHFDTAGGETVVPWQDEKEFEHASWLTIGPGETLFEVMSPESCFGVFTGYGGIRARCRAAGAVSDTLRLFRRPARPGDPPSALRAVGPLHGSGSRDRIQVRLWSLCAGGESDYLDCDEALFTVAWDRLQVAPAEAEAVVDTLIARDPGSGWCRPAIYETATRLPGPMALRWLEEVAGLEPGGLAGYYATELLRRASWKEFPPR